MTDNDSADLAEEMSDSQGDEIAPIGLGAIPVNGFEILEKLAELPIATWRYNGEPESIRHLGPMAQDFRAAFGLGDSDRHIYTVDASGVAFTAIQALFRRVKELEAQVSALQQGGTEQQG